MMTGAMNVKPKIMTERIEFRVSPELRARLDRLVAARGKPAAVLFDEMIERAHAQLEARACTPRTRAM